MTVANQICQPAESVSEQQQLRLPLFVEEYKHEIRDNMNVCSMSLEEAHALEKMTRDQSNDPLWYEERRKRITASRFGGEGNPPATEKCFVSNTGSRTAPLTKYMKAGLENEASAIK